MSNIYKQHYVDVSEVLMKYVMLRLEGEVLSAIRVVPMFSEMSEEWGFLVIIFSAMYRAEYILSKFFKAITGNFLLLSQTPMKHTKVEHQKLPYSIQNG